MTRAGAAGDDDHMGATTTIEEQKNTEIPPRIHERDARVTIVTQMESKAILPSRVVNPERRAVGVEHQLGASTLAPWLKEGQAGSPVIRRRQRRQDLALFVDEVEARRGDRAGRELSSDHGREYVRLGLLDGVHDFVVAY